MLQVRNFECSIPQKCCRQHVLALTAVRYLGPCGRPYRFEFIGKGRNNSLRNGPQRSSRCSLFVIVKRPPTGEVYPDRRPLLAAAPCLFVCGKKASAQYLKNGATHHFCLSPSLALSVHADGWGMLMREQKITPRKVSARLWRGEGQAHYRRSKPRPRKMSYTCSDERSDGRRDHMASNLGTASTSSATGRVERASRKPLHLFQDMPWNRQCGHLPYASSMRRYPRLTFSRIILSKCFSASALSAKDWTFVWPKVRYGPSCDAAPKGRTDRVRSSDDRSAPCSARDRCGADHGWALPSCLIKASSRLHVCFSSRHFSSVVTP